MGEPELKTFLIETELQFAELLYGDNVVDMAKKVLALGLDRQQEKRRVLARNLRIAYLKEVERLEAEKELADKKAARKERRAARKLKEKEERAARGEEEEEEDEEDDDDDSDEDSEEEKPEQKEGEEGEDEEKEEPEPLYVEPTEEELKEEKSKLDLMEAEWRKALKDISLCCKPDTRGEYLYGPDVAKQFLTQHYNNLDNPERDEYSILLSFAKECTVNLGSSNYFEGAEATTKAILMAFGSVKIEREIVQVVTETSPKKNVVLNLTCTSLVSIDGDHPRRVMEMMELGISTDYMETTEKGQINLYEDCYVCKKLLTIVQDPRPLYLFADEVVPKTKRDNMEPWARALIPLTEEEIKELELAAEASERDLMTSADEESEAYNAPLRAQERAERKAIEDKERAAKYGFGSDDEDDDEEEEEEEQEGEEDKEEGEGEGGAGEGAGEGEPPDEPPAEQEPEA